MDLGFGASVRDKGNDKEQIKNLEFTTDGHTFTLTWMWPYGVDSVYIFETKENEDIKLGMAEKYGKLYTRDEYVEFNGFHGRVTNIGRYTYSIFPYIKENGQMILVNQNGVDNCITVSTGKIHIEYSIKEKRKFFSNKKLVTIIIKPESFVERDVLCYVKKAGSMPISKEDGLVFPFIEDFNSGVNIMPDIEIDKNEYIKIFLTDGKKYGDTYEVFRK